MPKNPLVPSTGRVARFASFVAAVVVVHHLAMVVAGHALLLMVNEPE